jgi:RNA polymerase sigma-70 factor, ECF subfamily
MTPETVQPDGTELTDHELMSLLAQGKCEALDVLVLRHQAHVFGLAHRFLGQWDLAEDVAQEAFVRVFRGAAAFRPEALFTTWLYRLVTNLCWDQRRKTARDVRLLAAVPPRAGHDPPSAAMENQQWIERVRNAIASLPDRQRMAVILHRYQGLSHREIAEVTGWSQGAVESCLVRAYEKLRSALSDFVLE